MTRFLAFLNSERGATAVEYALIAAIITVGLLLTWSGIASKLSSEFSEVSAAYK